MVGFFFLFPTLPVLLFRQLYCHTIILFYYPLTPKSDQQLISPYIITPESARTKEALDC